MLKAGNPARRLGFAALCTLLNPQPRDRVPHGRRRSEERSRMMRGCDLVVNYLIKKETPYIVG
jgi:hypothetical protein